MKLLILEHKREIALLDSELQALNTRMLALPNLELMNTKEKELNELLGKISRDTISLKEKKFSRDFEAKTAYIWPTHQPRQTSRKFHNQKTKNYHNNESEFSDSSLSSVSSTSFHPQYSRFIKSAQKRQNGQDHSPPQGKRRNAPEHPSEVNTETMGHASHHGNGPRTPFLGPQSDNHPQSGTKPAHYPRQQNLRSSNSQQ